MPGNSQVQYNGQPHEERRLSVNLTRPYITTRQLSYRKEDRAMRPIYGCPEKF